MVKKVVVLLGLPGSGKGTQGAFLASELAIPHISTGDIFRKIAKANTKESKLLNEYMQEGKLIPSDLVNKIIKKFILSDECKYGCILDGYPRNLKQAEYIEMNIEAQIVAVFFEVKKEVIVKRILGRYACEFCGALYNKYFALPKIEGICDMCGGHKFVHRADDDEKTILSRIDEYKKETLPLIDYYQKKEKFFVVNAGANRDEVIKEISLIAKKI